MELLLTLIILTPLNKESAKITRRNSLSKTTKFGKELKQTLRSSKRLSRTDPSTSQCRLSKASNNGIPLSTIFTKKPSDLHLSVDMLSKLLDGELTKKETRRKTSSHTLNPTTGLLPIHGVPDGEIKDSSEFT